MSKISIVLLVLSGTFAGLVACNGGGFTLPSGIQCPTGFDPVPLNVDVSRKVSLDAAKNNQVVKQGDSVQAMRPGTYVYQRADLFYIENPATSNNKPVILAVQDVPVAGVSHPSVSCIRNSKANMNGYSAQADSVTEMVVSKDPTTGEIKIDAFKRHYSFNIMHGMIKVDDVVRNPQVVHNPAEISASDTKSRDQFMVQNVANDFEIRTSYLAADGATYALSVHMTYTPNAVLPAAVPSAKAPAPTAE